ncbi:MAG TPA: hypothetical protein PK425_01910 [Syntrophales bacterium]|nr:hypothetical protein [Syntrophales bacterium]
MREPETPSPAQMHPVQRRKNDHDRHHDHHDDYRHHRRKSFLHDLFD